MNRQWCSRERPLGKTPEVGLQESFQVRDALKDPSDPCKPLSGVFPSDNMTVHTYALSSYGFKIILDRPKYQAFWACLIHFGQVQIIKFSPEKSKFDFWTN